jgi:hypothetical protein
VVAEVSPRVREVEDELITLSRDLGSLHDSASWFTLLVAGELAASMPAGQRVADIPAGELVRMLETGSSRAISRWRQEHDFDQREVPVD